jgi:hypothetical protein
MATANHGTNAQTHPDTTNRDAALDKLEAVAEA